MSNQDLYLGIDVGSVSVNLAVIDAQDNIIEEQYIRHHAHPMQRAAQAIQEAMDSYGRDRIAGLAATGNGGRTVARILGADFVNEVVAQAAAARQLFPQVKTVIEIGGEDSKLIFIEDDQKEGSGEVADFAMNAACAAGTGSFLDQQASRMGLDIEEFGQLALQSEHPPRVAGRCSVFAKTDMIHLQQKATPSLQRLCQDRYDPPPAEGHPRARHRRRSVFCAGPQLQEHRRVGRRDCPAPVFPRRTGCQPGYDSRHQRGVQCRR